MFTIMTASRRRRLRATKSSGFTLMELVVVSLVATVLLALTLRWVFSLINTSQVTSAAVATSRDLGVVRAVFTADATNARGCSTSAGETDNQQFHAASAGYPGRLQKGQGRDQDHGDDR